MVFILSDNSKLPWSRSNSKVLNLIRNCIQVNKPLFVTAGAALSLVYLCATNFDSDIKVINEGLYTKNVKTFFDVKPNSLAEMILDPKTGDLFEYNPRNANWMPKFNSG